MGLKTRIVALEERARRLENIVSEMNERYRVDSLKKKKKLRKELIAFKKSRLKRGADKGMHEAWAEIALNCLCEAERLCRKE